MIKREFDAIRLNEILNDPSVLPFVSTDGTKLDLTAVIANKNNYLLMGEFGGVLFFNHQPGLYEAHTQILPQGRGKAAIELCEEALRWMFCRTDAVEILARVPHNNIAVRALTRRLGFYNDFTNEHGWVSEGKEIAADIYSMTIQLWMSKALHFEVLGKWFHDLLHKKYQEKGKEDDLHTDSTEHNRRVGICVEMIYSDQPAKAIAYYNRWAVAADYLPLTLVSLDPIIIDMRESVIQITENSFDVLKIR